MPATPATPETAADPGTPVTSGTSGPPATGLPPPGNALPIDPPASAASLRDLARTPLMRGILVRQARRGISAQHLLRAALIGYIAVTLLVFPPGTHTAGCAVVAGAYLVFALGVYLLSRGRSDAVVRRMWVAFVVDLVALTAVTALAATGEPSGWTSTVLIDGFFVLPLLAATQLRPWVAAVVTLPSVAAMLVAAWLARGATAEPWGTTALRALLLAAVGAGAYLLSRVQRFRVLTIGGLADQRRRLLEEVAVIEAREREDLAVNLHDGALQYVLAAAQDLEALTTGPTEELPELDEAELLSRVSQAVAESAVLLRSSVSDLHPRVLTELGLVRALEDLAETTAQRGRFAVEVDTQAWPATRTPIDILLLTTARELLANVVRHAQAHHVTVSLTRLPAGDDGPEARAELVVLDDGVGFTDAELASRLRAGHIGLEARRTRIEAASGRFAISSPREGGVRAVATIPIPD